MPHSEGLTIIDHDGLADTDSVYGVDLNEARDGQCRQIMNWDSFGQVEGVVLGG